MISWYQVNENFWEFRFEMFIVECSSLRDIVICSLEAGITWKEMHKACDALDLNNHNYAEFNSSKRFLLSERV